MYSRSTSDRVRPAARRKASISRISFGVTRISIRLVAAVFMLAVYVEKSYSVNTEVFPYRRHNVSSR